MHWKIALCAAALVCVAGCSCGGGGNDGGMGGGNGGGVGTGGGHTTGGGTGTGGGSSTGGGTGTGGGTSTGGGTGTGGGSSPGGGGGGSGTGGGMQTGPVTGHALRFYRQETMTEVGLNPSLSAFKAFAPLADGGLAPLTFTVTDGGTDFTIPDAPPGEYYLQYGSEWFLSDRRALDLDDYNWLGRPSAVYGSSTPPVTVNATGVVPANFVELDLSTPNTNLWGYVALDTLPSSTSLSLATGTLNAFGALPDGHAGDHTFITETEECDLLPDGGYLSTDDGGFYYICNAYGPGSTVTALSIDADAGATLNLTLAAGSSQSFAAIIAPATFLQHASEVHPQAEPLTVDVSVIPSPGYAGAPPIWASYSGVMLELEPQAPLADMPVSFGYSDPFPADWVRFATWSYIFRTPSTLPNTTSLHTNGTINESRLLSALPATLTARLSPPRLFTVDAATASNAQTLGRLTPLLQWSPPSLGTATGYTGRVYSLTNANGATARTTVLFFRTPMTHFQLPPGVLTSGGNYLVKLTAFYGPGLDLAAAPLSSDWTIDQSSADTMSGILTAP